jgi:outer membrane protein assembly factor BamB
MCIYRLASLPSVALCLAVLQADPLTVHAQSTDDFTPVTDAMLADPSPNDWLMWRRTLDGWGYSPLDQITRANVSTLRMAWTRALRTGSMEGTPLAYDGVLYMPNSSDAIQAIDAVTGDLKWEYLRDLPDDVYDYVGGNARNNRNIAIYDRFIVNTSDDNYAFALDATTGEVAWETQIFDYRVTPAGHSSGPIIADGKMIESGTIEEVTRRGRRFEVRVGRLVSEEEAQQLDQTEHVRKSIVAGDRITVDLDGSGEGGIDAALCALLGGLLELGLPPHEMREGASLEEAYLRITGDEASAELEE